MSDYSKSRQEEFISPYYEYQPRVSHKTPMVNIYDEPENEIESDLVSPAIYRDDNIFDSDKPDTTEILSNYDDSQLNTEDLYGRPRAKSTSTPKISHFYGRQTSWAPQPQSRFEQWVMNGRVDDMKRCKSLVGNIFHGKNRQASTEEIQKDNSEAEKFLEWVMNGKGDMYKSESLLFDESETLKPPLIQVEDFD